MEVRVFGVSSNYQNGMAKGVAPWPKKLEIKACSHAHDHRKVGCRYRELLRKKPRD